MEIRGLPKFLSIARTRNATNTTHRRTTMGANTYRNFQQARERKICETNEYRENSNADRLTIHQDQVHTCKCNPRTSGNREMPHRRIRGKEVQIANAHLKSRKLHGADGIPGAAYAALGTWIAKRLEIIPNKIRQGGEIPPEHRTYTNKKGHTRNAKLHAYMPNANRIQNMANNAHRKANPKFTPHDRHRKYGYRQGLSALVAIQK